MTVVTITPARRVIRAIVIAGPVFVLGFGAKFVAPSFSVAVVALAGLVAVAIIARPTWMEPLCEYFARAIEPLSMRTADVGLVILYGLAVVPAGVMRKVARHFRQRSSKHILPVTYWTNSALWRRRGS